jgi:antitoxin MazE
VDDPIDRRGDPYLYCNYNGHDDVRAKLVRIGNSRGVRLPKALIQEAGLTEEVELHMRDGAIEIRPAGHARAGWAESARVLHDKGEDVLAGTESRTRFDSTEWTWDG